MQCRHCLKDFDAYKYNVLKGYGRYCSKQCSNKAKPRGFKHGHGRLYSDEALERKRKKISGAKHWNWQGGITSLIRKIRNSFEYKKWRKGIYKKDNKTCVLCGSKKRPEADHYPSRFIDIYRKNRIKTYEDAIKCKELWDIKNGRTLCYWCHKLETFS